jgi:protein tyrosine phosphatase (PTP) superfamily phosphohydrolase (DUF442 family)
MAAAQLSDIFNFVAVSDTLGTAGQPTAEQLDAVQDAGYTVVINLATGTTPRDLSNEAVLLQERGIDYIHIPVIWDQPTAENLAQFFQAMDANQGKKCFVHCIANMRVSAFVYLYRVLKQGVPEAEARAMMNRLWEPNVVWQNFIDEVLAEKR